MPFLHATRRRERRPQAGDERGSVTLEFTLVAATLVALTLGAIQLALAGYAREAASFAADDALTEAQAYNGNPTSARALAVEMLGQFTQALTDPAVTVRRSANQASVTVTGSAVSLLGYTQTITVTDSGPVERFGAGG
ncbi:TadE/TadG family type IV pilus assembly protein [Actinospica robiniae]|uniref:TadE/TadG family type IV pilus assembly protein n=1 Tax=Actinospica robiniae TaxID=304901 RepID=UPI0004131013|nr:TadE family protein [Actinospica robiniae]